MASFAYGEQSVFICSHVSALGPQSNRRPTVESAPSHRFATAGCQGKLKVKSVLTVQVGIGERDAEDQGGGDEEGAEHQHHFGDHVE